VGGCEFWRKSLKWKPTFDKLQCSSSKMSLNINRLDRNLHRLQRMWVECQIWLFFFKQTALNFWSIVTKFICFAENVRKMQNIMFRKTATINIEQPNLHRYSWRVCGVKSRNFQGNPSFENRDRVQKVNCSSNVPFNMNRSQSNVYSL